MGLEGAKVERGVAVSGMEAALQMSTAMRKKNIVTEVMPIEMGENSLLHSQSEPDPVEGPMAIYRSREPDIRGMP